MPALLADATTTGAVAIEAAAPGVDAAAITGAGKATADAGAAGAGAGAGAGGGAAAIAGAGIGAGVTGVDAGRAAATGAAAPGPVVVVVGAVDGCDAVCRRFRSFRFLFSSATRAASAWRWRSVDRRSSALPAADGGLTPPLLSLSVSGRRAGRLLLVVDRRRHAAGALAAVRLCDRRRALRRRREALAIGAEVGALGGDRLARLAGRDGLGGLGRGHRENDAGLQAIHVVAAEGARIGAEQRHQHLVERDAGALRASGDLRQRVAGANPVFVAREAFGCAGRCAGAAHAAQARSPRRGPWPRAAAARAAARRSRASARAASRAASRASRAETARPAVGGSGVGAGGAAEITGDVEAPGAGVAPARIVAGGSNSSVYSRTSRPVAHEISRMTSTNGS